MFGGLHVKQLSELGTNLHEFGASMPKKTPRKSDEYLPSPTGITLKIDISM